MKIPKNDQNKLTEKFTIIIYYFIASLTLYGRSAIQIRVNAHTPETMPCDGLLYHEECIPASCPEFPEDTLATL